MRKTVIALLLVFAMLMVSCKPENTVKEPTADEFLSSLYVVISCDSLTENLYKSLDSDGNIDKTKIGLVTVSDVFEDEEGLHRYTVTEITNATGTVKSEDEAENIVISFKYYVDSRESRQASWPTTHEGEAETGVLAFSYKEADTSEGRAYSNLKLNFNPYKDGFAPSLKSEETTSFKAISFTFDKTREKLADSASVEGVKLNDTEWAKVDPVINAAG